MKRKIKSVFVTRLLSLFLIVIPSSFLQATEKEKSSNMPIDLTADQGTYDQLAGVAIYEGNVKVSQGQSIIWADKMIVTLKDNVAHLIEAYGSPVKFIYKGDKQPINGQGGKMVYKVPKKIVTLTGNAIVEQGTDIVKGDVINYNLDKEIIDGQHVKMTFLPKD